jgi:hypothetical protein
MRNVGRCSNCGKVIFREGSGGDWYHRATVSTACRPGSGSGKRASPVEVSSR